jgi:YaiO family outer membrane protein
MLFLLFSLICFGLIPAYTHAVPQKLDKQTLNTDELFKQARELGFSGKRQQARELCRTILEKKPGYHEVRVFLGRLFLWDKVYDAARKEFLQVIRERPDYKDAYNALIDAEYWTKNLDLALKYCDDGLRVDPDNEDFLLKKTKVLMKKEDYSAAVETVERLLEINPSHREALLLLDRIQYSTELFKISQKYRFDGIKKQGRELEPWHLFALELSTKTPLGTLIGRVNYASRTFGSSVKYGRQFEVDAYPKFADGFYAYLNAGYSGDSIFPKYRFGGELYLSLPASFEFSAGIRYLEFSSSNVLIYTGNLGKYYKNYWFSIRPFITDKTSGFSVSTLLLIRRYIRSRDNYLGFSLGYGSSPVEIFYLEDIERLNSYKIGVEINRLLSRALVVKCLLRFEREEYVLNKFGNRITFNLQFSERIYKHY